MSHLQKTSPDQEKAGTSQAKNHTLGFFHGEAASVATEDAADGYQAPSMVAAGANAEGVALLVALTRLPVAFLYSRIPQMMRSAGSRKNALIALVALDTITWLPLIAVLIFLRPVTPFWLIACWLINLVPGTLVLPVRDGWLADSIPAKIMGRYLGIRTFISAALYLGMFYVMGYILDYFAGQVYLGFAVVFWMAFCASLFKGVLFSRMKDNADPTKRYVRFGLADFVDETKRGGLGRFLIYVSLLNWAVYLSAPFFAVYMVSELHFSYTTFAMVSSADFIARALSASYWGKYSDRIGSLPLLERISYLVPLIPLLWLVSPNVIYLICVQLFSGTVWAGFEVCSQSLIYKSASPEKRGGYIIYQRGMTTLGQAIGALAGAGLFGFMVPVFGSKILGLFLLSGILRFVVGRVILPGMTPERASVPTRHGPTKTPGIYTRPREWPAYVRDFARKHTIVPPAPQPRPAIGLYHLRRNEAGQTKKVEPAPVPAFGLYHVRHDPACFAECRATAKPVEATSAHGLLHVRQSEAYFADLQRETAAAKIEPALGLYHDPKKWAAYLGQSVDQTVAAHAMPAKGLLHQAERLAVHRTPPVAVPVPVAARGLYHQPEKWVAYRRQKAEESAGAVVPANGLFHNPQQWSEHVRQSTIIPPARVLEKVGKPITLKTRRLSGKLVPALAYA